MANMTLRLDDVDEVNLSEIMASMSEGTKSKAIIKMIRSWKHQQEIKSEFIERTRKAEYKYNELKSTLQRLSEAKADLAVLVSN